jgi:hypothetical protein
VDRLRSFGRGVAEFFTRVATAAIIAGFGYWVVSSYEPHDDFGRFLQGAGALFFTAFAARALFRHSDDPL